MSYLENRAIDFVWQHLEELQAARPNSDSEELTNELHKILQEAVEDACAEWLDDIRLFTRSAIYMISGDWRCRCCARFRKAGDLPDQRGFCKYCSAAITAFEQELKNG